MKVNGWGYPPRGDAGRVACPHCTATLEFGRGEVATVRLGRARGRTLRCARCKRSIDLNVHRPMPADHCPPTPD